MSNPARQHTKVVLRALALTTALAVTTALSGTASAISIKEAVNKAVSTNPRLKAIENNREAVNHELRRARGQYLPQVDLLVGNGLQQYSSQTTRTTGTDDDWLNREEYSITLSQRLFDGFETNSEVERQKARVRSAANRVYENAEVLGLDAALVYLEVFRQRALLALARDNVKVHEDILSSLKRRQEAGGGSVSDTAQTEARLARSRATVLATENELRDAEAQYRRLIGDSPDDVMMPEFDHGMMPQSSEEAVRLAEEKNPTVRIFDAEIDVATRAIEVSEAPFYPNVNLEAGYTYYNERDGVRTWEDDAQIMVRLRWNLYRGGSDRAGRRAAVARQAEAKSRRFNASLEAVEEMKRSWNAYVIESDRLETLNSAVDFSQRTRDLYRQQFDVAQRSLLDVLDAENELFVTSGQQISADVNRLAAAYRILASSGELMAALEVPTPEAADPTPPSFRSTVVR